MNRISTAEYIKLQGIRIVESKVLKSGKVRVKSIDRTEHEIQSNILERLAFEKEGFFWRENSGSFNLGTEGNKRFFRAGIKGIADIMGIYKGRGVAIEVKRPKTKNNVSLDQKAFLARFKQCGGIAVVCWDDETVIDQLKEQL